MANHVYFNISIETDDKQKLSEILDFAETDNGEMKWKTWEAHLFPIYPEPYSDDNWYQWGCDNMGAKWVSIDEAEIYYINGHSAWSPPIPMLNYLAQYLGGETSLRMTYEDEFRNFIGVAYAHGDGTSGFDELDGDDVTQWLLDPLNIDELPDDFEWWEPHPALDGWSPQEYLDEKVNEWFNEV